MIIYIQIAATIIYIVTLTSLIITLLRLKFMKAYQVPPVNKKQYKPIKYWQAEHNGKVIATDNNISLLRYKCKDLLNIKFVAIR
jgi:hypothetical protein